MLLTNINIFSEVVILFASVIALLLTYLKWNQKYWERANIPYIKSTSLIFGNTKDIVFFRQSLGQLISKFYEEFKRRGEKIGGIVSITKPILLIMDPELLKNILVRDFNHFCDRHVITINFKSNPLLSNLLFLKGQKWKNLRGKVTPTFSTGKMKFMFQTLVDTSKGLEAMIEESVDQATDIKKMLRRFTIDVIGTCVFGLECNSMKNPNSEFIKFGRLAVDSSSYQAIKIGIMESFPNLSYFLGIKLFIPCVTEFFRKLIYETAEYRETNNVLRKDILDILIKAKNTQQIEKNGQVMEGLTMDEIVAEAFLFFTAGFETSFTALTFCMFELTQNLEVQEILRQEIHDVLANYDGQIAYESLMNMKYMDKVINETFRKYPPFPLTSRMCTQDYIIQETKTLVKKGTTVFIPILGLHNDPEYFPNPEQFDPERFSEENSDFKHSFKFMPFGEGPRNCVGIRFALMLIKIGLISLLRKHKWILNDETKLPLRIQPLHFVYCLKDSIWLQASKL